MLKEKMCNNSMSFYKNVFVNVENCSPYSLCLKAKNEMFPNISKYPFAEIKPDSLIHQMALLFFLLPQKGPQRCKHRKVSSRQTLAM